MVHHHPLLRSFPLHYHFMIVLILVGCLMFLLVDCYWLIITLLSYYSPLLFANPHCFILLPIFVHFISTSLIIPPTLEPLSFQLIFHFHLVHFPHLVPPKLLTFIPLILTVNFNFLLQRSFIITQCFLVFVESSTFQIYEVAMLKVLMNLLDC